MGKRKKLQSILVALYLIIFMVPSVAYGAWNHGNTGSVAFTKILYGKDGKAYYINENVKTLFYTSSGSTKIKAGNGRNKVRWRYLKVTNKASKDARYGYCMEFGANFKNAAKYKAINAGQDQTLFQSMPVDTQKIISAALCYGRNGSRKVPVSGTNDADYYFATQVLIWEAQQNLRKVVKDRNGNYKGTKLAAAHSMPANHMQRFLKGRSGEKCYSWLVKKINDHLKTHSFAAVTSQDAPVHELKENPNGTWSVTLTDKNKKQGGIRLSTSEIAVKKKGYQYTFSSKTAIEKPLSIPCKTKMEGGSSANKILVWHCRQNSSYQAVILGSNDLTSEYIKVKSTGKPTDIEQKITIRKKDKDTGKTIALSGTTYQIQLEDTGETVIDNIKTDSSGHAVIEKKLKPGTYQVKELKAPDGYTLNKTPVKFKVEDASGAIEIEQKDQAQKGVIKLKKEGEIFNIGKNKVNNKRVPLKDITFHIVASEDITTGDGTVQVKKGEIADRITTDKGGNANSKALYLGKYNIVEKGTPEKYQPLTSKREVALEYAGQNTATTEVQLKLLNKLKSGAVQITKSDISTGRLLPSAGIEILNQNKKVILKGYTNDQGIVVFDKLPVGKYYFREFDAPKGYKIDESPFPFEIRENNEIVKCKMTNQKDEFSPQTDDTTSVWLYFVLALTSLFVIFIIRKVKGMKY